MYGNDIYLCSLSTDKTFFHCSCDVNWIDAYGIIRAIVAEFPLQRAKKPSLCNVLRRNRTAAWNEYGISLLKKKMNNDKMHIDGVIKWLWRANMQTYWIWKLILARSSGAITVLATPPANAPQNKFITTVFTFDGIESGNVVFNEIFPNVVNYYGKFSNTYVCRL